MTSKPLKPWLLASVLLNVFLLGGVGGGLYHWMAAPKPAEAVVNQHGLRQAMIKLPAERRKELRALLRHNRSDSQPLIMAGREARLGVIKQLEAPTLDRDALVTELAKAREADASLRALVDGTLAQFASNLPQDERRKLVEALYQRGQSGTKEKLIQTAGNKPRS
ncbi:periplasmic heavy metal sensor [Pseudomonas tolaasii]|uniref:periplasmic heavy metal sensor n=1 Tax=Pseudomonas tolaasii TaxID=29442 RepID=UPI0015A28D35|nr:periplasmic heavy metal sensor [Pseudomonas tolaasii]NVZ47270.1 periplasmic heavy metal sensor [Pseudomonas tolaasii]NWA46731.1 periplasmic heavy metal sensor [Pseudomonas tolaasii]